MAVKRRSGLTRRARFSLASSPTRAKLVHAEVDDEAPVFTSKQLILVSPLPYEVIGDALDIQGVGDTSRWTSGCRRACRTQSVIEAAVPSSYRGSQCTRRLVMRLAGIAWANRSTQAVLAV